MAHTRSRHTITLHFHCYLYLCHRIHIMYPFRSITFTSWVCMSHLPQFILFVLVAAMWVHLVHIATFILHITPMCIICTAATKIFLLILPLLVVCFLWHGQAQGCNTWLPTLFTRTSSWRLEIQENMEIWKIRHSTATVHLKTPYFEVVSSCNRFSGD